MTKPAKPPIQMRRTKRCSLDMSKPANVIIAKWGGLTVFCNDTGFADSTVYGWQKRGYVPQHQKGRSVHSYILEVAKRLKKPIKQADFYDNSAVAAE